MNHIQARSTKHEILNKSEIKNSKLFGFRSSDFGFASYAGLYGAKKDSK